MAPAPAHGAVPHQTLLFIDSPHSIAQGAGTGEWISPWQVAAIPFDRFLPSWNVASSSAFRVEAQVAGTDFESPWLDLGGWGAWTARGRAPTEFDGGKVAIDVLQLTRPGTRARIRLVTTGPTELERLAFCFTDSARLATHEFGGKQISVAPLAVPQRRQTDEAPGLAPRICSPTSVSMVLDYRGHAQPTARVAAELYDVEHDIYGNWNRAVQGAARFGVPGYLTCINDWTEAAAFLRRGTPLVLSIGVKAGQLSGAPYSATAGHLIVLVGLDGVGQAIVLDPAVPPGDSNTRAYALDELDEVWLRRGGTAYVLGE